MSSKKKVFIVDDSCADAELIKRILNPKELEILTCNEGKDAIEKILEWRPDCVIVDIMMPEIDGTELIKTIKSYKCLTNVKIIAHSAKSYEYDRRLAYEFGADGFISKPIIDHQNFKNQVIKTIDDEIEIAFWGVRGTLPVPGDGSLRYGGNTSSVSIKIPNKSLLIFDAGTGIKNLGSWILDQENLDTNLKIFISHPHWDHLNAIPFFAPLYRPGNNIEILGPKTPGISIAKMISAQMSNVYFPITVDEFSANVIYRDLLQDSYEVDKNIKVKTILLRHPGNCLGYRVDYNNCSICYVTDNELFFENSKNYSREYFEKLREFIHKCDILITDTTYTNVEYQKKVGWGHSSVSQVCDLAVKGEVRQLCLFHHDPDQNDDAIDAKLKTALEFIENSGSEVACIAPQEGLKIRIKTVQSALEKKKA